MFNSVTAKVFGGFAMAMLAGLLAIRVSGKPSTRPNGNQNRYTAENPKGFPEKETQIVEKIVYKETPIPHEYLQALQFAKSLRVLLLF